MKTTFLDFEQAVAELETKIEELRYVQDESSVDISSELKTLSEKKPTAHQRDLRGLNAMAGLSGCPPSTAPLHTRLHPSLIYRLS